MWYLLASYNGKLYNLGAGLNQNCCAQMMTVYYNHYDNAKVKLSIARRSDINQTIYGQFAFVAAYKKDHFLVAQLENYDVSARFE